MYDSDADKNIEREVLRKFIVGILHVLVKENKIDMTKTYDPIYLANIVSEYESILDDADGIIEIHHEFIDAAKEAIKNDKPIIAVVLLSTSVEQILNLHYRLALLMKGLSNEDITQILKRSNSDAKVGWLTSLVFGFKLSNEIKRRAFELIEIRNSIVHYKAVPDLLGSEENSYSRIKERIRSMDESSILTIPTDLQIELNEMLDENEPEYKTAKELSEILSKFLWPS